MAAIEIKNLSFVYSQKTPYEKKALDNVNLSINEGDFVGVVGATGSGKSTLIQHFNGLIKTPKLKKRALKRGELQGEVVVLGKSASDKKALKELRFKVGMVFQYPEYQLFEDSVAKDVAFGPKNMGLEKDEIDRRVKKSLELVGLDYNKFADRSPFELSGGEKRRVAIAGVIAMQPEILVLDEPVAGLDPAGREELLSLILKLKNEVSPTVVMVSHNMDDIAALANRIVALRDGKIVYDGSPEGIFGDAALVQSVGLELPTAARIAQNLRARGVSLSGDIITLDALKNAAIEAIKSRGGANV